MIRVRNAISLSWIAVKIKERSSLSKTYKLVAKVKLLLGANLCDSAYNTKSCRGTLSRRGVAGTVAAKLLISFQNANFLFKNMHSKYDI